MATTPQRAYRAACPNCGAPVEFKSAASASAVCSFCRSTLLRDGESLRRIGAVAELFDDHSPLQLGAAGKLQGVAFTLVGRLQYGYEGGSWNEWHALFDNGRSGWLSDDNGAYVFAFDTSLADAPALAVLQAGARVNVAGQAWDVASTLQAQLISAEGELPAPPRLAQPFGVVDLRNAQGEVGTLDYGDAAQVGWAVGRSVALSELALSGLREDSSKTLAARSLECPNCGAALPVKLASTQSISCPQCSAVVDISKGAGAELAHFQQSSSAPGGLAPQIALGSSGTLALGGAPVPWQVVGYQERCDVPAAGDDEEPGYWREYLLYNRSEGFAFLVDAEDGWSWVKPLTGAPQTSGRSARWQGTNFQRGESYAARVSWVLGEFYWRVQRGETALVSDYAAGSKRLSREQTGSEVVWSAGEALDAASVAAAFGVAVSAQLPPDVLPTVMRGRGAFKAVLIFFAIIVVLLLISRCGSSDDCSRTRSTFGAASTEYQQCLQRSRHGGYIGGVGGAYGGWSSGGGGHK